MYTASGGCHCGSIRMTLELERVPSAYNPRVCDCDFCSKHGAAYVSDPSGSLVLRVEDERRVGRYRQGSGIAEMLVCRECGVLIGALYRNDNGLYAAVNARALEGPVPFGAEQSVSPKALSSSEKTKRWQELWFSNVKVGVV